MDRFPASMTDLMDMFPIEEAYRDYLTLVRWPVFERLLLEEGAGIILLS